VYGFFGEFDDDARYRLCAKGNDPAVATSVDNDGSAASAAQSHDASISTANLAAGLIRQTVGVAPLHAPSLIASC
jgi:hypothetical protein